MTILGLVNERSEFVKEYKHTRRMVMSYHEKQRRQGSKPFIWASLSIKQTRWWGGQMSGWHDLGFLSFGVCGNDSRKVSYMSVLLGSIAFILWYLNPLRVRIWNGKATFSNDWRSGRCCWYLSVPSLKSCRTGGALSNLASPIEPSLAFSKIELSCFHLFSSFMQERIGRNINDEDNLS